MSISTRVSIAWPPEFPPEETTDTLVFSFPSQHFIDLRFIKNAFPAELDWGFAGKTMKTGNHTTFIHMLDSRNPLDPLSVQDSGEFEILPNGDERETGQMVNPATGRVMPYEEIWRMLAPSTISGAVCLQSAGDSSVQAFIGRVGQYYQGICVHEGRVSAVRRVLAEGSWKDVYSVGDEITLLPVLSLEASARWKNGQMVSHGGREWIVLDVVQ